MKLYRAFKWFVLICLILLASLGIGMVGGVPLHFSERKKHTAEIKIEMVEDDSEESEVSVFEAIL